MALAGLDLTELAAWGRGVLDSRMLTLPELRPLLADAYPERDPQALVQALRIVLPLVQVPPRGVWGQSGQPTMMTATGWLGQTLSTAELNTTSTLEALIWRYPQGVRPGQRERRSGVVRPDPPAGGAGADAPAAPAVPG
ncbi:DNA glycosylase AlkZ-like family protein [Deinococcus sp.]|uniref:DNA glycosylase AlkZ-like family protein n=1 Tax=Deinococcus sp. TaxID=47478 RepID=UPI002869ACAF|nr:hypothetical protein [Deinococcus sp.]